MHVPPPPCWCQTGSLCTLVIHTQQWCHGVWRSSYTLKLVFFVPQKKSCLGTVTWKTAPFSVNVKYDHEQNMVFQVFCYLFIWNPSNLKLAMDPCWYLKLKKTKNNHNSPLSKLWIFHKNAILVYLNSHTLILNIIWFKQRGSTVTILWWVDNEICYCLWQSWQTAPLQCQ